MRSFCIDCPDECKARASLLAPQDACLQEMWESSQCYPQCNSAACLHRGCSAQQIASACLSEEDASLIDRSTSPAAVRDASGLAERGSVPVAFTLRFYAPLIIHVDNELNQVSGHTDAEVHVVASPE